MPAAGGENSRVGEPGVRADLGGRGLGPGHAPSRQPQFPGIPLSHFRGCSCLQRETRACHSVLYAAASSPGHCRGLGPSGMCQGHLRADPQAVGWALSLANPARCKPQPGAPWASRASGPACAPSAFPVSGCRAQREDRRAGLACCQLPAGVGAGFGSIVSRLRGEAPPETANYNSQNSRPPAVPAGLCRQGALGTSTFSARPWARVDCLASDDT